MADVRWLTYDEMARDLGITRESARQLTIRKRWPRQKGNDGRARIGVPEDAVTSDDTPPATPSEPSDATSSNPSSSTSDDTSPIRVLLRHIERLERELEAAREDARREIEVLKGERDAALARTSDRDALAVQLDAINAVLAIERSRVEEWKSVADRFASQVETMAKPERRSWWPWRRSA
jgi:hypothetical protein